MGEVPLYTGLDGSIRDYRGTSLIRNSHPPWDHHRALDRPIAGS